MSLKVFVVSATNVPNLETFGNSDPYAIVEFQGRWAKEMAGWEEGKQPGASCYLLQGVFPTRYRRGVY